MTMSLAGTTEGFLGDIAAAEQQTPLPPAADAAAFAAAAKARGAAVAQVISHWLATAPYEMLQQLLDQPVETMPIFQPAIGPVIVMRHAHVVQCLERTDLFTVDPYAAEMARATDDKIRNPQAFSHFMLGTDRDELYRLDDVILRRVVSRADEDVLSALIRDEAAYWTASAAQVGQGELDVVQTLGKFVPLRIVRDYLGIPYYQAGEPAVVPGLHGGQRFPLDGGLQAVFSFTKIQEGMVPTPDDLFTWVKDAFRNIFNNFNPAHPMSAQFRERGLIATEYLTAWIHALLTFFKEALQRGDGVPDSMLTRLLRLQLEVSNGSGHALEQEFASMLGTPLPAGEVAKRLSNSMIRSNVFGTAVGAVVNAQEATARMVDSLLRLQEAEYEVLNGSTFEQAVRLANTDPHSPDYPKSLHGLRKYALEALRLRPQGEVLLRLCVQDTSELGGTLIRKGTPVFVAYAAAMRDPAAMPRPLAFDITRDERPVAYLGNTDRAREAPQSQLYLQHGYGRHKCLGRYASEITMRESLRALLRLQHLQRRGTLEMDEQRLYPSSLRIGFC